MRNYNLYPQNPSINRGHWKSVEDNIIKWLRSGKYSDINIEYQARLVYENDKATRPEGMHFLVKFKVGNRIATLKELNEVDGSIEGPIDNDYLPNPSSSKKLSHAKRRLCFEISYFFNDSRLENFFDLPNHQKMILFSNKTFICDLINCGK